MSANDSRRTGLLRLRHLSEVTEARAEDMALERGRFERLADPARAPRVVSAFNLFQTPPALAARLAGLLADGRELGRTLEPSAGLGRLYRAVRDLDTACPVVLVEQAAECCAELFRETENDRAAQLIQGDFTATDAAKIGRFDSVLMNPPFKNGADIRHIAHARSLLAPGGRLVGLCAAGPRQRAQLQPIAAAWIDLPPGSFRSEGTDVDAAIVVFHA